jgi:hypothetical protein
MNAETFEITQNMSTWDLGSDRVLAEDFELKMCTSVLTEQISIAMHILFAT